MSEAATVEIGCVIHWNTTVTDVRVKLVILTARSVTRSENKGRTGNALGSTVLVERKKIGWRLPLVA